MNFFFVLWLKVYSPHNNKNHYKCRLHTNFHGTLRNMTGRVVWKPLWLTPLSVYSHSLWAGGTRQRSSMPETSYTLPVQISALWRVSCVQVSRREFKSHMMSSWYHLVMTVRNVMQENGTVRLKSPIGFSETISTLWGEIRPHSASPPTHSGIPFRKGKSKNQKLKKRKNKKIKKQKQVLKALKNTFFYFSFLPL